MGDTEGELSMVVVIISVSLTFWEHHSFNPVPAAGIQLEKSLGTFYI
jgi:hypothetical protein